MKREGGVDKFCDIKCKERLIFDCRDRCLEIFKDYFEEPTNTVT